MHMRHVVNPQDHPLNPRSRSGSPFGVGTFPTPEGSALDNERVSCANDLLGENRAHR